MKVIATGGLAPLFERATGVIEQTDRDLTLRRIAVGLPQEQRDKDS